MNFTAENLWGNVFYRPPDDLVNRGLRNPVKTGIALATNPHARVCPRFDETGIAMFPLADWDEVGFQVQDNCAEEHIQ